MEYKIKDKLDINFSFWIFKVYIRCVWNFKFPKFFLFLFLEERERERKKIESNAEKFKTWKYENK